MSRKLVFFISLSVIAGAVQTSWADDKDSVVALPPSSDLGSAEEWQAFLDTNCVVCHSQAVMTADLMLEGVALPPIDSKLDILEKVVRKLEAGEMPPAYYPLKPPPHETEAFLAWLTATLGYNAVINPDVGRPAIRRLTRVEYSNAVGDLLGIDIDPGSQLPPDSIEDGFTNNAEALSLSPLLLERYMSAARNAIRLAIGDPSLPRTEYTFSPPQRQEHWRQGLPFGTRGFPTIEHYFPADGEYVFRVFTDLYGSGRLPEVEGERFFQQRVSVKAGSHSVAAVVPEEGAVAQGPITDITGWGGGIGGPLDPRRSATPRPILDVRLDGERIARFDVNPPTQTAPDTVRPGSPWIRRLEIDGPYNPAGPGETRARQKIFTCLPDAVEEERACAQNILTEITRKAYRREVRTEDIQPFMAAYNKARERTDFEGSVQRALETILVSPAFLFRVEHDPAEVQPGENYAISNYELATRLSFFLWSSIPDDRLLDIAASGRLTNTEVLVEETHRMLEDSRAQALADNFGMQFLGLHGLDSFVPDETVYPNFNTTLREDMAQEVRLLLQDVLLGEQRVIDLIGANYTYLNERLARHYGIDGVVGDHFRRVSFEPDHIRSGILGTGAVLMTTSSPNVTSPVHRGQWVLANLLNSPPSPPPPGVPALVVSGASGEKLTGREQMELHRTSEACTSCHQRMDPYGFALENLDVVGVWREEDEGGKIDPAVSLPNGTEFSGIVGLRSTLVGQEPEFARAVTERLMTYGLGRSLDGTDAPAVRQIMSNIKSDGYRFSDIVVEIVKSDQFRMRRK